MGSLVGGSRCCGFIDLERHRDGFVVAVYLRFVTFITIKISSVLESKGLTFVSVRDVKRYGALEAVPEWAIACFGNESQAYPKPPRSTPRVVKKKAPRPIEIEQCQSGKDPLIGGGAPSTIL